MQVSILKSKDSLYFIFLNTYIAPFLSSLASRLSTSFYLSLSESGSTSNKRWPFFDVTRLTSYRFLIY